MKNRLATRIGLCVVAGLALGLGASLLNHWPHPVGSVASKVIGVGWVWVAVGVLCGWLVRSVAWGAVGAAVALSLAVAAYYGADFQLGVYDSFRYATEFTPTEMVWLELLFMVPVGLITGMVTGPIGAWCCRADWLGLMARLVVPFVAASQMVMQLPEVTSWPPGDLTRVWVYRLTLALALLTAVLIVVQHMVSRRRRSAETGGQPRLRSS